MQNLIYFPSFEPESQTWLKYALLYIDEFSPIVPPSGNKEMSDDFRRIEDNTNLVRIVQPEIEDGFDATDKTIEEIEKILGGRSSYKEVFNDTEPRLTWTDRNNWSTVLYREKFNSDFATYCIKMEFAANHEKGLILSPELSGLFMTFLAESIAYRKHATPITDRIVLDNMTTYLRTKNITTSKLLDAAKIVVDTKLPREVDDILLEKFIEFRNRDGIDEMRKAFNSTLDKFYESVENNFDPYSYIEVIKKTNKEYMFEIGKYLGELGLGALGVYLVLKNNTTTNMEMAEKVGQGLLTFLGISKVHHSWKLNEQRRNARKFLSRIKHFNNN
jgi:hypothetical protein